ncbi:hypothetical protein OAD35_01805 [Pseudomonadales bacterium]|nr:hypothetical protein [Pseudomonadales bacterium]
MSRSVWLESSGRPRVTGSTADLSILVDASLTIEPWTLTDEVDGYLDRVDLEQQWAKGLGVGLLT